MNRKLLLLLVGVATLCSCSLTFAQEDKSKSKFETVTFESGDGLEVTADVYIAHQDKSKPFIVLCHQAGWSRGEYREIAPRLNAMGFNCLAIDQRSGGAVNKVPNETMALASKEKKPTTFVDAEQDMVAAIDFAKKSYADGKLILWGSSYSSALALRIAGEHPDKIDAVMAFAPGEYFQRFGKAGDWIETSAAKISDPAFITSAKNEFPRWKAIYDAIKADGKTKFVPSSAGNHGSRALWKQFDDSGAYWAEVEKFLKQLQQ